MHHTSTQGGPLEIIRTINPDHVNRRVGIAHQSGHAYFDTECPRNCRQVDAWAAVRLITPQGLLRAARVADSIDDIARVLWVTPGIVTAYIGALPPDDWLRMRALVGRNLK